MLCQMTQHPHQHDVVSDDTASPSQHDVVSDDTASPSDTAEGGAERGREEESKGGREGGRGRGMLCQMTGRELT